MNHSRFRNISGFFSLRWTCLPFLAFFVLLTSLSGQENVTPQPTPRTVVLDFRKSVDASRAPGPEIRTWRTTTADPELWNLKLNVDPGDSDVFIDGVKYSGSTINLANPSNLNPSITISHNGYKSFSATVNLEKGFNLEMSVSLAPRIGWLGFDSVVPIQEIHIDGQKMDASKGMITVHEGYHSLRVRSFGYQDFTANIQIDEDTLHSFTLGFSPVEFAITDLMSSRKKFRPGNPGLLGTSTLKFLASAPGTAVLVMIDSGGKEVRHVQFPVFTTWSQQFSWDGKDDEGVTLPEGEYLCTLAGTSTDPGLSDPVNLETRISIDQSIFMKARVSGFGTSGSGSAMDTFTLGEGGISLGSTFSVLAGQGQEASANAMALDLWVRGSPVTSLELTGGISAGLLYEATDANPTIFLYGGAKYQLIKPTAEGPGFSLALGLKGSGLVNAATLPAYREVDNQTAGLSLDSALQFKADAFFSTLDLGLRISVYDTWSASTDAWLVPGPTAAVSLGFDNDVLHLSLGGKVAFLDFYNLFSGTSRSPTASTIATNLGSFGLLSPPRFDVNFTVTSPWSLAFGINLFCTIFPGTGFFDHPGISASVMFLE